MAAARRDLPAGGEVPEDYVFGALGPDGGETEGGQQLPMLNVFRRDAGGVVRHFWGSELLFAGSEPGHDPRHSDTIDPLWNLFDFTPDGRGSDWYPDLTYG